MSRRAVFADRDGTIIVEKGYLGHPDGVEMIDGALEALGTLQAAGFVIVVVTNQAGIAHGFYSRDDYQAVALRFVEEFYYKVISFKIIFIFNIFNIFFG